MKRRTFISTAAISAAALATGAARAADPVGAAPAAQDLSIPTSVFPRGDINPYGKFFTGESFLTMLSEPDDVWNCPIGYVTFKPGARTNWHKHSGGQILLVTAGLGRYCERGGRVRILRPGDVVRIPPNVEHWHGADDRIGMIHISIETNVPDNKSEWLAPVTHAEYGAF